jgi:hypothetical protein
LAWLFEKWLKKNRAKRAKYHLKESCKRATKYHIGMSREVIYNEGGFQIPTRCWGVRV